CALSARSASRDGRRRCAARARRSPASWPAPIPAESETTTSRPGGFRRQRADTVRCRPSTSARGDSSAPPPRSTSWSPPCARPPRELAGRVAELVDLVDRDAAQVGAARGRNAHLAELRVGLDRQHALDLAEAGDDAPL